MKQSLAYVDEQMRMREADLARLREQLVFQEEVERKARQLKAEYDEQRAGGIYLSWKLIAPVAAVGLAATLYMASRINGPHRKGWAAPPRAPPDLPPASQSRISRGLVAGPTILSSAQV